MSISVSSFLIICDCHLRVHYIHSLRIPGFVQILQFRYQRGCLYRLRTLGERHNMDITIEGFHSWMWRGLSFLLPFLFLGYTFQLYNAYTLYQLSFHPEATWQVWIVYDFSATGSIVYNYVYWMSGELTNFYCKGSCSEWNVFCRLPGKHCYNDVGNTSKAAGESEATGKICNSG